MLYDTQTQKIIIINDKTKNGRQNVVSTTGNARFLLLRPDRSLLELTQHNVTELPLH